MVAIEDKYSVLLVDGPHRSYLAFVGTLHDGDPVPSLDTQVLHTTSPFTGEVSLFPSELGHGPSEVYGAPKCSVGIFDGCVATRG